MRQRLGELLNLYERVQDWVEIMLAPSAVAQVPDLGERCRIEHGSQQELMALDLKLDWAGFLQQCVSIPFHVDSPFSRDTYQGFAVVPTNGMAHPVSIADSVARAMKSLDGMKLLAPDPRAQAKYERASQWLYAVHDKGVNVNAMRERMTRT